MEGLSWLVWAGLFGTIVLLSYGVFTYYANRRVVRDRFQRVKTGNIATTQIFKQEKGNTLKKRFLEWVSSFGKWAMDDKDDISRIRATLIQAGFRHPKGPGIYFGMRALAALVLPLPYLMANAVQWQMASGNLLVLFLLGTIGFYLPRGILDMKARRRQDRIDKALPDILDLLIVCMEAGLALQAAITRVGEEVQSISKEFYAELQITNAELRTGIPRETALRNLGERTGVQNVKALTGLMIQSEKMGASIAHSMRVHASFLRVKRSQQAEEIAAKLPVKILFPMLFFIFPAIFIVVLGPAVIQASKTGMFN